MTASGQRMDCRDIRRLLDNDEPVSGREVEEHLETCEPCRELVESKELARTLDSIDSVIEPTDVQRMMESMAQRVEQERGATAWLKSLSSPKRLGIALALIAVEVAVTFVLAPRADLGVYPVLRMVVAVGAMGALAMWAASVMTTPLHSRQLGSFWSWATISAAPVLVGVLSSIPVVDAAHPASLAGRGDAFVPAAAACFIFGVIIGVPVIVMGAVMERRSRWPLRQALTAAAAAGLAGNLALQLHCPITAPAHLLAGHASVCLALPIALGLLFAAKARR